MLARPRFVLALSVFLLALAFPVTASAAYFVNSTGDQPDEALNGTCKTAVNTCTLRAAIEESNKSEGVVDTIEFDSAFNGENTDTITAATDLPTITDRVNILGYRCETEAGVGIQGPCVGVVRSGGGSLFVVDADEVQIEGLAITGATNGINVINESDGFIAKNDWVGVNLKGAAVANGTGILLGRGADGATIGGGGVEETERNVIAGNTFVGLDLEGASGATIRGNYFGVAPNGTTPRAQVKDIEITDSTFPTTVKATNDEIGETISLVNRASPKCDGGCNVIGGASATGVDLEGDESETQEAGASGPTIIRGNYVGLGANGETVVANATFGVLAGAADNVQVGGSGEGETNNFAGGLYGVYGENGDNLDVLANVMGRDRSGAPTTPPAAIGIFNISNGISVPARIALNSLEMSGGIGIEQRFTGAEITNNDVWGGAEIGIQIKASSVGEGNLIEANRIREATGVGILIESDGNEVFGNEVLESASTGILVKYAGSTLPFVSPSTGNVIGGDEEGLENEIVNNGGPAIRIADFEETNNEVGRNHGSGNSGQFIDLAPTEFLVENGPNEGIKPPVIATALQTKASGTALPGATIRVFRKASAEAGELNSFLAEAVADGSGNWKVSYGSIPGGTIVAATQTNTKGGTSELATATAASEGGGGGNGGNNNGGGKGGNKDTTPPDTKILKGPPKKSHKTTAKFKFSSSEANSTFECKLDRKPFKKCASPKKYKKLKPGKHVFKVRAIDKAGNVDPTPAKRKFTVLR